MINLEELKKRCEENSINYAYGRFKEATEPPFLVAISTGSNNFSSDNSVYKKIDEIELAFAYIDKDFELEKIIENIILKDVVWEKTSETYLEDEEIWQVSYFFNINKD